jgi:endonuclease/exonuclease/phosphatase family metal-dependent hydrolase
MLAVFILLVLFKIELLTKLPNWLIWIWNGIFVISLVGTIISHQVSFPLDEGLYPYIAAETPILGLLLPLIMVISFPILLIDCLIFSRELVEGKLSIKNISIGFTISAFFFLLMIFAHVFTTVYDYIPVVGPFFRDKFWFVYLIVGLGVFIPIITLRYESFKIRIPAINIPVNLYTVLVLTIAVGTIIGVAITSPLPTTPEPTTTFKVLSYNIRQGNSEDGIKNFDGQLNVLRQIDADIIGLQESDITRLSGGNNDIVRYFANSLNYYSYYGPKTVVGTFGIALLSRYPIQNTKTFYMYSEGEQTATIETEIKIGTTVYNIYVTHLGNDGPLVQQQAIVSSISGKNNIILMGDFNFRPYAAQYNLTTAVLNDSWENPNSSYTLDDGLTFDPTKRIDHIFVSLEVQVVKCIYHVSKASDHPALWIEIQI